MNILVEKYLILLTAVFNLTYPNTHTSQTSRLSELSRRMQNNTQSNSTNPDSANTQHTSSSNSADHPASASMGPSIPSSSTEHPDSTDTTLPNSTDQPDSANATPDEPPIEPTFHRFQDLPRELQNRIMDQAFDATEQGDEDLLLQIAHCWLTPESHADDQDKFTLATPREGGAPSWERLALFHVNHAWREYFLGPPSRFPRLSHHVNGIVNINWGLQSLWKLTQHHPSTAQLCKS
jgi:hypothetical protein